MECRYGSNRRAANSWAYSDSQGWTELLDGGPLTFVPLTDGYELAAQGPDSGVELNPTSGGQGVIEINRTQIAERCFRLSGQGTYASPDSVATNGTSPIADPVLGPAGITGQDGGTPAVYKGLAYWFWGDTNCARYPNRLPKQLRRRPSQLERTAAILTTGRRKKL